MTGLLLAGIGHTDAHQHKNFVVVDGKTSVAAVEAAFREFTTQRKDIAVVLINQHVRVDLMSVGSGWI